MRGAGRNLKELVGHLPHKVLTARSVLTIHQLVTRLQQPIYLLRICQGDNMIDSEGRCQASRLQRKAFVYVSQSA